MFRNVMREFRIERDDHGREFIRVPFTGVSLLRDPIYNKSTCFPAEEREALELQGLLPPNVSTEVEQVERVYGNYRRKTDDLERYNHLMSLYDRNQTLFHRLLHDHLEEMMPIVYTPTVGLACQLYSRIFRRPRGLYLTPDDAPRMEQVLSHAPFANVAVIVVTDNESILGLGDLGMGGMGIPIGKLALYTAAAGIHPAKCLPIDLDIGTENESLLADPLYLGVRQRRLRGDAYYDFMDVFAKGVQKVFPNAVLQWEDFRKEKAFTLLEKYRGAMPSFNDDIQGTGAVALGGVLAASRMKRERMREQRILIDGAGAAGAGIAGMLRRGLERDGLSPQEAKEHVLITDSHGLLVEGRSSMEDYKKPFAQSAALLEKIKLSPYDVGSLEAIIRAFRPSVLIGVSGQGGSFTENIVRAMAEASPRPVVMPFSNPTSNAECTPEQVFRWTRGKAVVATGSPFAPVAFEGRTYRIAQGNNVFIFPGVGMGAVVAEARTLPEEVFVAAGFALAEQVSDELLAEGRIYPDVKDIRRVSRAVALAVAREAVHQGAAPKRSDDDLAARLDRETWEARYLPYRK